MKLKVKLNETDLAPEGAHSATVKAINPKGEKEVVIDFEIKPEGKDYVVSKVYPARLDDKSPLLKDAQVLLGREFSVQDTGEEVDLSQLVNKTCLVVVVHRRTTGRKLIASVLTVSALPPVAAVTR